MLVALVASVTIPVTDNGVTAINCFKVTFNMLVSLHCSLVVAVQITFSVPETDPQLAVPSFIDSVGFGVVVIIPFVPCNEYWYE